MRLIGDSCSDHPDRVTVDGVDEVVVATSTRGSSS